VLNIFIGVVKMKKISSIADGENKALLAEIGLDPVFQYRRYV
jgi:hypothetical protein